VDTFVANAHRCFDFLVSEHGFTYGGHHWPLPELGNSATSVRYDAPHLFVWVHLGSEGVEVLLFVKIHTSILRPGGRRSFTLQEFLRHQAPGEFSAIPPLEREVEIRSGFAQSLARQGKWLREQGDALLRLDLKPLEEIVSGS
jgi:hypothetical protein